jgi:hypothetical protein
VTFLFKSCPKLLKIVLKEIFNQMGGFMGEKVKGNLALKL